MTRDEFRWLYINSTQLAEAAIRRFAEDIVAATPPTPINDLPEPGTDLDARLEQQFASLDLSALDDIESDMRTAGVAGIGALAHGYCDSQTAQEINPELNRRLDHAFDTANLAALRAALASVPEADGSLTSALAPAALSHWINRYCANDPPLASLVASVRALVMSGR